MTRIITFIITTILFSTALANAAEIAEVYSISGSASYRGANSQQWNAIKRGLRLSENDTVKVGVGARLGIRFDDGKLVRLRENSELTITPATDKSPQGLNLLQGAVHLFNRSRSDLRSIQTPEVSAAIRGTEVVVESINGKSSFTVFDGEVSLTNTSGQLRLARGETGEVRKNSAPRKLVVAKPLDGVQWILFVPTILSSSELPSVQSGKNSSLSKAYELASDQRYTESLQTLAGENSDEAKLLKGTIEIQLGRIDSAKGTLESISDPALMSAAQARLGTIALVKQEKEAAIELYHQALQSQPVSPSASLLGSFIKSSTGSIEEATDEITLALKSKPEEAGLLARKAELLLGQGDTKQALKVARKAYLLAPNDPVVVSILGFAYLARDKDQEAEKSFQSALEIAADLPVARFGLGLSKITQGDLAGGRGEIEQAVHLDSSNSIYRSYLGKAFFEELREDEAEKEYDLAIERDPNDPTPYLYRAFNRLSRNKVVAALRDIESSVERNDARAVYRSRSLLDQDTAVRSTSLAEVFRQLGFREAARIEALKGISKDYTNFSAHRFLGEILEGDFFADAKFSQQLISELLAPVGFNVFQSFDGFSAESSLNDYAALFDRPVHRTKLNITGTNVDDTYEGSVIQTGSEGQFGYLASYASRNMNSSTLREHSGRIALQFQPSIDHRFIAQGSVNSLDDNLSEDHLDQIDAEGSLGSYHRLSANTEVITRFEYFGRDSEIDNDTLSDLASQTTMLDTSTSVFPEFDIDLTQMTDEEVDTVRGNVQVLHRHEYGSLISGVEYIYADGTADEDSIIVGDSIGILEGLGRDRDSYGNYTTNTISAYSYLNTEVTSWLDINTGISYRDVELPQFDVVPPYVSGERSIDRFSPKVGVTISPDDALTFRGAYFRTLGNSSVNDIGSIEPTVVGSFVQLLGDLPGARAENYGVGVNYKDPNTFYTGFEYIYRDIERDGISYSTDFVTDTSMLTDTFSLSPTYSRESEREDLFRGYLYTPISEELVSTLEYRREALESLDISETNDVDRVRAGLRYFSDQQWFLTAEVDWYHQYLKGVSGFSDGSENFWIVNLGVGYRIPKRQGLVQLQLINALDQSFDFASRDRFTDPPESIGFLSRATFNF